MIKIRRSQERGRADHGWLNSYHSFSFADYYDPKNMGYRSLRVLNEDRVAPGRGFGAHPHRDMEILSYVIEGTLTHQDNMGHQENLGPNEIQRMSAGTGVMHSEFNGSKTEPVHFVQIWIEPKKSGLPASYEQLKFESVEKQSRWKQLAGPVAEAGVTRINQDAKVFVSALDADEEIRYPLAPDRYGWLQVVRGEVNLNGKILAAGDAAAIEKEEVGLKAATGSEVLLFDLA